MIDCGHCHALVPLCYNNYSINHGVHELYVKGCVGAHRTFCALKLG